MTHRVFPKLNRRPETERPITKSSRLSPGTLNPRLVNIERRPMVISGDWIKNLLRLVLVKLFQWNCSRTSLGCYLMIEELNEMFF